MSIGKRRHCGSSKCTRSNFFSELLHNKSWLIGKASVLKVLQQPFRRICFKGRSLKRLRQANLLWQGDVRATIATLPWLHFACRAELCALLAKHRPGIINYAYCQAEQFCSIGSRRSGVSQTNLTYEPNFWGTVEEHRQQILQLRCTYLNGMLTIWFAKNAPHD